jgi:hypothetical protein
MTYLEAANWTTIIALNIAAFWVWGWMGRLK